jgi:hypothetical protein
LISLQEQNYSASAAETIELPDEKEKAQLASDPMFHLEYHTARKRKNKEHTDQVAELIEFAKARVADGNDVELNRELKRRMRVRRASEKASEKRCVSY